MGHPARGRRRPAGVDARVAAAAPVSPRPMPACRARCPVPGALAATAQGACRVQCQPDPVAAPARAAVTPAARAGPPLANRAAGVTMTVALRLWSRPGTGRTPDGPVSEYGRVPGPGTRRRPGCSLQPRSLAERGKVPAAGQLAGRTVYTPPAFRDRLAESNRGGRGPPWPWRAPHPQPRRSRWRRAP